MAKMLTTTEYAKKAGKSKQAILAACEEGRIPGAVFAEVVVRRWQIPADSEINPGKTPGPKPKPDKDLRRPRKKSKSKAT